MLIDFDTVPSDLLTLWNDYDLAHRETGHRCYLAICTTPGEYHLCMDCTENTSQWFEPTPQLIVLDRPYHFVEIDDAEWNEVLALSHHKTTPEEVMCIPLVGVRQLMMADHPLL